MDVMIRPCHKLAIIRDNEQTKLLLSHLRLNDCYDVILRGWKGQDIEKDMAVIFARKRKMWKVSKNLEKP